MQQQIIVGSYTSLQHIIIKLQKSEKGSFFPCFPLNMAKFSVPLKIDFIAVKLYFCKNKTLFSSLLCHSLCHELMEKTAEKSQVKRRNYVTMSLSFFGFSCRHSPHYCHSETGIINQQ
jgi:hypothetical protein